MFDFENDGQPHKLKHSQWCNSMENVNFGKSHMMHFVIALIVSEIPTFQICDLENLGQRHVVKHLQWSHLKANINLYKSHTEALFFSCSGFEIFTFQNSCPWKCRSRSWRITVVVAPFDGKYLTSNVTAIVMFALSLVLHEIFESPEKLWPWKWMSRSRSRKTRLAPLDYKRSSPCNRFFQDFSYKGPYLYAIDNTHLHTARYRGDDYRHNLL